MSSALRKILIIVAVSLVLLLIGKFFFPNIGDLMNFPNDFFTKALMAVAAILAIVVLIKFGRTIISSFEVLFMLRQRMNFYLSQTKLLLNKKYSVTTELLQSAKLMTLYEGDLHRSLAAIRSVLNDGRAEIDTKEAVNINDGLNNLSTLATFENYPNLSAQEGYILLSQEITRLNDELIESQNSYNECVCQYNTYKRLWPLVLIGIFFPSRRYIEGYN